MHDECPLSSRSWSKSCVGMVTRISAEGGGEKGKEMRRGERKRAERREKQRWGEFSGFQTEMSLLTTFPMSHTSPCSFSCVLSHSCFVFLCLSAVTATFALNSVYLILLFMSSLYPPMYVCVCVCVCVVADSILRYLKVSSVHHFCHRTPLLQR